MLARLYLPEPLVSGEEIELPSGPSRHVQVLRLQPGQPLILFDGQGSEWLAEVTQMTRQSVWVRLGEQSRPDRELATSITLAVGVPANDRMDTVVEKAGELGAFAIEPLICARSVLRLDGERAKKKQAHWQAVAAAASEQCGRARVTRIGALSSLKEWLGTMTKQVPPDQERWLLSPNAASSWRPAKTCGVSGVVFLSGPEGGLSVEEETLAQQHGFIPVGLGPRILRADTAPLAVLAAWALSVA